MVGVTFETGVLIDQLNAVSEGRKVIALDDEIASRACGARIASNCSTR